MIERLWRSPRTRPARAKIARCVDIVFCGTVDKPRQLAGGDALRLTAHEQPERVEARRLGERRQGGDDFDIIHISRIMDILLRGK